MTAYKCFTLYSTVSRSSLIIKHCINVELMNINRDLCLSSRCFACMSLVSMVVISRQTRDKITKAVS